MTFPPYDQMARWGEPGDAHSITLVRNGTTVRYSGPDDDYTVPSITENDAIVEFETLLWSLVFYGEPGGESPPDATSGVDELEIGRHAFISHRCTGMSNRATWNGVGWHCTCGDVVFPPIILHAVGVPGHHPTGKMTDEAWLYDLTEGSNG